MPQVIRREQRVDWPRNLRAFIFHGVDLQLRDGASQAKARCPFCDKEGDKFSVAVATSQWECKSCGASGNARTFLEHLHKASECPESASQKLSTSRSLLHSSTLGRWGCVVSAVSGEWLVPGYDVTGTLTQLYRWLRFKDDSGKVVNRLMPTPGVWEDGRVHALHGAHLYDEAKDEVFVCEGPWDGMALWEVLSSAKRLGDSVVVTGSVKASLAANVNVVAVPGANVFREDWLRLFAGKSVTLLYDNDHRRKHPKTGRPIDGAGLAGTRRAVKLMLAAEQPPKEVKWLQWSSDGFDPELPTGHDVRDILSAGKTMAERVERLSVLLGKVDDVPKEWTGRNVKPGTASTSSNGKKPTEIGPLACDDWATLQTQWHKAMRWRQEMTDVLATMLAVACSTDQAGDQLFLQLIGSAGSGKTRLCDAMLVSRRCFALEHMTGFHSGWKSGQGEDYSLLTRINRKTLITPEGDVMMSSPNFDEIMSQQRRIFDGTSGVSYKTLAEDRRYTGLRTPWIIAGTPALMDRDQSRLGDRFIRIRLNDPDDEEKRAIQRRVFYASVQSVAQMSNCDAESHLDSKMARAYRLTGGYVDYLRIEGPELLGRVGAAVAEQEWVADACQDLADLTACLRARPNPDAKKESEATKEMPSRLTSQFGRLTCCLCVVMGKRQADDDVVRIVKKVAIDTSHGLSLKIVERLAICGKEGADVSSLSIWLRESEDKLRSMLHFMLKLRVVETDKGRGDRAIRGRVKWRLSERIASLWERVSLLSVET